MLFRRKQAKNVVPPAAPPSVSASESPAAAAETMRQSIAEEVRQRIYGFRDSSLLFQTLTPVADHPCVLDILTDTPQSLEQIATQSGWNRDKARQLLPYLAGIHVVTMTPDSQYQLGPVGVALTTQPVLRVEAELAARILSVSAARGLTAALATGEDGFTTAFGMGFYPYLGTHPDDAHRFGTFMHLLTEPVANLVSRCYPAIKERHTIVDIGAGDATLLTALLFVYGNLNGIAFDSSIEAAQRTKDILGSSLTPSRLTLEAGDFLVSVPQGDALLLMQVLHNLGDAEAVKVLTNCATALEPGGVVVVIEQLLPEVVTTMTPAVEQNVNMALLFADGRERTQDEYTALLVQAGLTGTQTIPLTPSSFSLMTATKS